GQASQWEARILGESLRTDQMRVADVTRLPQSADPVGPAGSGRPRRADRAGPGARMAPCRARRMLSQRDPPPTLPTGQLSSAAPKLFQNFSLPVSDTSKGP